MADDVLDLTKMGDPGEVDMTKAMAGLKRNMAHLLISTMDEEGPEIDFGERGVLKFRPKVPATAMIELVGNDNKVAALQGYIRKSLMPESHEVFDELLDDIPLDGLNSIVEFLAEAHTSFPSK